MTTSAEQLLSAMKGASAEAIRELEKAAAGVDINDPVAVRRFANVWLRIIAEHGAAIRRIAADRYMTTRKIHVSRPYTPSYAHTSIDPQYALRRLQAAFYVKGRGGERVRVDSLQKAIPTIRLLTDELVKQVARNAITENAYQDRRCRGFIRVLVGDSCAFCVMLASRGAMSSLNGPGSPGLFKSRWSAGDTYSGHSFHGGCDCLVEPIFDPEKDLDRIKSEYGGYDPEKYYEMYLSSRNNAGSSSPESILAQMRKDHNIS